jgi:hypothetical protein
MENPYRSPIESGTTSPRRKRSWRLWRIALLYGTSFGCATIGGILSRNSTTVTGQPFAVVGFGLMGLLVAGMILLLADSKGT